MKKRIRTALVVGSVLGAIVTRGIVLLLPEGLQDSLEGTLIAWGGALLVGVIVGFVVPTGYQKSL